MRYYTVVGIWHVWSVFPCGTLGFGFCILFLTRKVVEFKGGVEGACKRGSGEGGGVDGWMKVGWSCQSHLSPVSPHPFSPCWQQSSKQNTACLQGNSYSLPAQPPPPLTQGNWHAEMGWWENRKALGGTKNREIWRFTKTQMEINGQKQYFRIRG